MLEIKPIDLDYIRYIENLSKNASKVVDRVNIMYNEETFQAVRKTYKNTHEESAMLYLRDGMELTESILQLAMRQIRLYETLDHPSINKLIFWYENKETIRLFFYDAGECIMKKGKHGYYEPIFKDSDQIIEKPNILYVCKEEFAKEVLKQIVKALLYLKTFLNVSHNDIKPANIVSNLILKEQFQKIQLSDLDGKWYKCTQEQDAYPGNELELENLRLELIDLEHHQFVRNNLSSSGGTTRTYIPPECVNEIFCNGFAKDIWSLGCVLHILLTGMHPIYHHGYSELSFYIESLNHSIKPPNFEYHPFLSEEPRNLIRKMLEPKVEMRIILEDILSDPWLNP